MLCWCFRHKFPPHLPVSVPGELGKHQSKQSVPGELSKHHQNNLLQVSPVNTSQNNLFRVSSVNTSKNNLFQVSSVNTSKNNLFRVSSVNTSQSQRWWCRASCPGMSVDILGTNCDQCQKGGGDSSVVRAPDSWLKGRGFESLLERREKFSSPGSTFCADSYFGIRSTPVLPQ